MDLENHSCGHIFCTFKANLIQLHVLVPIRLNRKLKIIFRATCRVKKQFTRPYISYVDCHIQHLVHVFSGERSRAIMALLFFFAYLCLCCDHDLVWGYFCHLQCQFQLCLTVFNPYKFLWQSAIRFRKFVTAPILVQVYLLYYAHTFLGTRPFYACQKCYPRVLDPRKCIQVSNSLHLQVQLLYFGMFVCLFVCARV